ncbi:MAG TPA: PQQ-dependent sugar dehydrogenase [Gemmatimonadaceae bacterium]|nr:PQQ-dependent sugar dehydrogenase [Gemmatimonadaceae bacterium]
MTMGLGARHSALGGVAAAMIAAAAACAGQESGLTLPTAPQQDSLRARLVLPAGFTVQYFARGLAGVRFMAVGPDGAVYASQPRAGQVVRLVDTNGDGVADKLTVVATSLDRPHGLAFHGGYLYIALTSGVVRMRLDAHGVPSGAPERIVSFAGGGNHWTRSIAFGADSAMYIAMGSTCNLCVETDSMRAAVTRYDADGGNGHRFAYGLRNAVGIALNPVTKELWVSQNERDNLPPDHENLPPDEINILRDGGDYGWPYCYSLAGAAVPNPEYNDAARCASTIPAALDIQAHSAPLGIAFLDRATKFPSDWRGDLVVALHGSWDRSVPTGAKVIRVHIAGNKPVSSDDFITGWQLADGTRWGRPVDVTVTADGALLVSDDSSGAIYRVSH